MPSAVVEKSRLSMLYFALAEPEAIQLILLSSSCARAGEEFSRRSSAQSWIRRDRVVEGIESLDVWASRFHAEENDLDVCSL